MNPVPDSESSAPLRALRAARPHVEALRTQQSDLQQSREALLAVARAVEGCLRLLQRDARLAGRSQAPGIPAPDAPLDEVFAEVCRDYSLKLDLASEISEVLDVRRRIRAGHEIDPEDIEATVEAYDRLRAEVQRIAIPADRVRPVPPTPTAPPSAAAPPTTSSPNAPPPPGPKAGEAAAVASASPPPPGQAPQAEPPITVVASSPDGRSAGDDAPATREDATTGGGPRRGWLTLVLLILILGGGALAIFWPRDGGPDEMEQGIALFAEERYADAASHFWRAAEADAGNIDAQLYLARIHRRMGRPELAEQALAAAEEIDPTDAAVAAERGLVELDAENAEGALGLSREAVRVAPESPAGWIALVRALWETDRVDEAAEAVDQAPADLQPELQLPAGG